MARIVLGNRDGAEALRHARAVSADLASEWPDLQFVPRTVRGQEPSTLVDELAAGTVGLAVHPVDTLPTHLPDGTVLAAVTRRIEPRTVFVSRQLASLADVGPSDVVTVRTGRDSAFLEALLPHAALVAPSGTLEADLALLTTGERTALVLPGATLWTLDQRNRMDGVMDPDVFAPAPGQGATGILVREDDDLAFELAYSLQHRPSFDRVRAERAFAAAVGDVPFGTLATVDEEGELTLFGAVARSGSVVQATVVGDASEGASLGTELAADILERASSMA